MLHLLSALVLLGGDSKEWATTKVVVVGRGRKKAWIPCHSGGFE